MSTTQVLSDAADLIERNGLHKGEYWPGAGRGVTYQGGPCCVVGALLVALRVFDSESEVCDETVQCALDAIKMVVYGTVSSSQFVASWNDRPDQTAEQVVSALRDAAKYTRGGA